MDGYDIIGDVHGCAEELKRLLERMGYVLGSDGFYSHPSRVAVFVGDLIDRGPGQVEVVNIVQKMVRAGTAKIAMGNHEFNAISYATADPKQAGRFMRNRETKTASHQAFLSQFVLDTTLYKETIEWFKTLPLWLELEDGPRIIHACWYEPAMKDLNDVLVSGEPLSDEFIVRANTRETKEFEAVEILLKGPELKLTDYDLPMFLDKGGTPRSGARIRWWREGSDALNQLAEINGDATTEEGEPYPALPSIPLSREDLRYQYRSEEPLVVFGHYWKDGELAIEENTNTICVDYSAVMGGELVAYRWNRDGGSHLIGHQEHSEE